MIDIEKVRVSGTLLRKNHAKYQCEWGIVDTEHNGPMIIFIYTDGKLYAEMPQGGWVPGIDVPNLGAAMDRLDFLYGKPPGTMKKILHRWSNCRAGNPGDRPSQFTSGVPGKAEFRRLFTILPHDVAKAAVAYMKRRRYQNALAAAAFNWRTDYHPSDVEAINARFAETLELNPGSALYVAAMWRPSHRRRFARWRTAHHMAASKKIKINGREYLVGLARG